jgi:enoyl-CoA hydratase/carnithine racemase
MSQKPLLLTETHGAVTVLRLNRPEVRNAVDDNLRNKLLESVSEIDGSDDVRAVVITGEGSAFCAGGDVSGMRGRLQQPAGEIAGSGLRRLRRSQQLIADLHNLGQVTIAAVNGPAAGYGVDLALACDFIVASETAFLAMSYIQRGLVPDGGGMYFLPRRVGLARAKDLILSGRRVQAPEALSMGLVDKVVPAAELMQSALGWATELAAQPGVAATLAKSILDRSLDLSADEVFALSAQATAICYTTADHIELVEAFLDKRTPRS